MPLDRALQRDVLTKLAGKYPMSMHAREFPEIPSDQLTMNLWYLAEHGLIDLQKAKLMSGEVQVGLATITAQGLDFLEDDGGLSAILGVVTVKLHEDTIRSLLIDRVQHSDADTAIKDRLIAQLKALPSEALKLLTTEALKAGVAHIPNLVGWLRTLPGLV